MLRRLASRTAGGTKWSLGPTRALLSALGDPQRHFSAIHVAGTNGKGSVCALVASAVQTWGVRTGVYTSPHLVDVRERIVVDGQPISEEAFVMWAERLDPVIAQSDASFFEIVTAIAFADMAQRGVEIAVVEVGLGGRLDATNVLDPLVSAVVSIGLDHAEYLGTDPAGIAREKAGVAKPERPIVIGEADPALARVIAAAAREVGADPVMVAPEASYDGPIGFGGDVQRRNAAIASRILTLLPAPYRPSPEARADGFRTAWLPGRFDRRGPWIFDVAHNLDAVQGLVRQLRTTGVRRPLHALVAILGDKDGAAMVDVLASVVDRMWLTIAPSAPSGRRGDPARWAQGRESVQWEPTFAHALSEARAGAGTILVTGSFHTVGDVMKCLPAFAPLG